MNIFSTAKRFDKFDKFIESCDFEKFFYKLILEHDDDWFELCLINGKNPEPTNKMKFIFDYLEHKNNQKFKKFIFYKENVDDVIKYKIKNTFDNKIIFEI